MGSRLVVVLLVAGKRGFFGGTEQQERKKSKIRAFDETGSGDDEGDFGTSVAKFVSDGLGMFLPHSLANNAAVGPALLGRVWILTFVDLLFDKDKVSKGKTEHT